jgi:hypothetical protein
VLAGNERHPARIFVVVAGATSKGGKRTSWGITRAVLEQADPGFILRIRSGFGSGEALVDEVRDPTETDPGPGDTRLLVQESEFARLLRVAGRDGSTLSHTFRDAWDGRPLAARSRAKTTASHSHHIGFVGHVTVEELAARLTDVETYGGFTNRFAFGLVRRSKRLPGGGNVPEHLIAHYGQRLGEVLRGARRVGSVRRASAAEGRWAQVYDALADDEPGGLLGAVLGRDAPQCLRLSLLYALLDGRDTIDVEHIDAAWALWSYFRASAAYIFGDRLGDEVADRLLLAIRTAGPDGLDATQQHQVFGRHESARRIATARELLVSKGLIVTDHEKTGGRDRLVSYPCEESESSERRSR